MPLTPAEDNDIPISGATPSVTLSTIDADCDRSSFAYWKSHKLTEVLIRWMRHHFGSANRIENGNLKSRLWVAGETTPIIIGSPAEWNPNNANLRPAVLIEAQEQQPGPQNGIDERLMGGGGIEAMELRYVSFWQGSHIVYCLGGQEGEVLALWSEVLRELHQFQSQMRAALDLMSLKVAGSGRRVKIDVGSKSEWMIPIVLSYKYRHEWRVKYTDDTALQNILLDL